MSPYKIQKSNQIQFFTYTNLAQVLNLTLVIPSSVVGEEVESFLFHSCGIIRHKNHEGQSSNKEVEDGEKEYNVTALKMLFPRVRFVTQHELKLWMKSRTRKPSIVHEFISIGGRKTQSVEVLSNNHQDFVAHEWSKKLDLHLFDNDSMKDHNYKKGVIFKKISLGSKSFLSKKSVKLVAQFLLDELKNSDADILLLAHDLTFKKFSKSFSIIENSNEYLSVEKIGGICNKMN
ncbi:318_t:CDS:1 [Acaulospora colombiana]|uniref:318_t:CDS:1 n=1 Tax=Acaulospora colombiana TaxID=27376 RepID=A0ACA9KTC1_9GLOM|nr:318_t:CDS:1 [Acaulospora colombiana]